MELAQLYENIPRRLSVRDFIQDPISSQLIDGLGHFLSGLNPPGYDVDWEFDILSHVDMLQICSREPGVTAPHYLVLRAQGATFSSQAAGYAGEMGALWLCSRNLGSCWQGGISVKEDIPGRMEYAVSLAFGATTVPMREDESESNRKELSKICTGDGDERLMKIARAVRLSPSSLNRQPVRLMLDGDVIHVFRKPAFLKNPVLDYPQRIDVGAALCHLELAANVQGMSVSFLPLDHDKRPVWGKNIYQSTAVLTQVGDD